MRIIKDGVVSYTGDTAQNKTEALSIITEWFDSKMKYNVLQTSVGVPIDNRRSGNKNDLENIRSLLQLEVTTVRGADDQMYTLTITELETIVQEMMVDGLNHYQIKWNAISDIESKTTNPEIWAALDTFIENNPILS